MEPASPARLYATAVGALLTIFGIVGFFYSASFGSPGEVENVFGVFAVNGWENALHILAGALGLFVAGYAARQYALALGVVALVAALWGFAIGSGDSILGFLPVNTADNVLHAVLGVLGILAALGTPPARERAATAT
jgi:hypothetical protein